jgi:hypothetical protein
MTSRILSPNDPLERAFGPAPAQCSERATIKDASSNSTSMSMGGQRHGSSGWWLVVMFALISLF